MGNHRSRNKNNTPAHMKLRQREAPQRPEPKSRTPSSASINTDDSSSFITSDSDSQSTGAVSDTNSEPTTTSPSPPSAPKIPPIFIQGTAWRKIAAKLLSDVPPDSIQAKASTNNSIKLQCIDIKLFRSVQKYLHNHDTEFHTVPSPEERTLKIVIRGLLSDITESEVSEELKAKGYEVTSVRQFGNATRKFPLHMVILASSPSSKQIFNEHSLFYMAVKIEPYKPCSMLLLPEVRTLQPSLRIHSQVCQMCSGSPCQKLPKDPRRPPTCANCLGSHTANYKNCPSLIQDKDRRRPTRPNTSKIVTQSSPPSVNPLSSALTNPPTSQASPVSLSTYASTTSNGTAVSTDSASLASQLTTIISNLASNKMKVKDALIALLTILPLIFTSLQHE